MSLPCSTSPVASTSTANTENTTESNSKEPQPGPSHSDDPKPGPSTTAAEFDLEVFDSGSSCSLEDAWGLGCSPEESLPNQIPFKQSSGCFSGGSSLLRSRRKSRRIVRGGSGSGGKKKQLTSSEALVDIFTSSAIPEFDNSSEDNGDIEEDMSLPPCPFDQPPVSMCPSETEEAVSDRDDDEIDELDDQDDIDEQENEEEEEECTCEDGLSTCYKCAPSTSSGIKLTVADPIVPPVEEFTVKVSNPSSTENIDEIVQDRDNFGTDENEDSLDSLALASGSASRLISLYRPDSEDSIEEEASLFGGSKRKNLDEPDISLDSEPIIKKKKKSSGSNASCSDDTSWTNESKSLLQAESGENQTAPSTQGIKQQEDNLPKFEQSTEHPVGHSQIPAAQVLLTGEDQRNGEHEVCSAVAVSQSSPSTIPPAENLLTTQRPATAPPVLSKHFSEEEVKPKAHPTPAPILQWVEIFSKWNHTEKILAIDELINSCHPTEVRHMMTVIEPQFQRDFVSLLPKELALYVLSFLDPRDLLRAAQTCRYWRILAEDNLLWREKCKEAGISDVLEVLNIREKKSAFGGFNYSQWKNGFMRKHNIEMNWRVMPVRPPKVLKGHDDHVITCLQFSANRIVSGSDDNTLKVWNATTGKCLKTLVGHTGGVWSSQMNGNTIVSGSTDRTLKVWNADTGVCQYTLYGHTSTVRCMHLFQNRVVSGSRDATLRMWDITTGECLHVLMGHVAAVRCVQYDGRLVVSGAYDYMVKVWNPETEECLHTLAGHTNRVYSLQFDGVHVVSGSLDTSIRVWDVETGACKHALMGHQSLTSGMELRENILVSGNADSTVKVWDITTGQCLQTLSGPNKHQSAVTCLQFNSKFVVTSSDDGTVKLWDVKTGEFLRDLVALESGGSGGVVWRLKANATKLVCAVGSRNGTEETKLLVLDFDVQDSK